MMMKTSMAAHGRSRDVRATKSYGPDAGVPCGRLAYIRATQSMRCPLNDTGRQRATRRTGRRPLSPFGLFALCLTLAATAAFAEAPRRPVSTYSIVARDPLTGELGVAVQSHWFSVGSIVTFAEAGV